MPLPAALALTRLLLAATGPAPAPPVELTWRAPSGCPDAAAVGDMVAALLRRPDPELDPDPPVARATVTRRPAGWELHLVLHASRSRYARTVRAEDCDVLARATALLIAVHLDPLSVTRGLDPPAPAPDAPPSPAPPLVPPPFAAPPAATPTDRLSRETAERSPPQPDDLVEETGLLPPPRPQSAVREVEAARVRLPAGPEDLSEETSDLSPPPRSPAPAPVVAHLRLDGGLDYGVLPGLGGHVGLFAGVALPRVRLEAGLVGVPLRIAPGRDDLAGGRFDRLVGAARICPLWRPRPAVHVGLCVGAEAGAIRGIGLQVAAPNPQWAPWFGLSLGPAVRWRLTGPVGLWFGVDGVLALTRPIFTVGGDDVIVFRAGRAGVRAVVGLDLQFGPRNR